MWKSAYSRKSNQNRSQSLLGFIVLSMNVLTLLQIKTKIKHVHRLWQKIWRTLEWLDAHHHLILAVLLFLSFIHLIATGKNIRIKINKCVSFISRIDAIEFRPKPLRQSPTSFKREKKKRSGNTFYNPYFSWDVFFPVLNVFTWALSQLILIRIWQLFKINDNLKRKNH